MDVKKCKRINADVFKDAFTFLTNTTGNRGLLHPYLASDNDIELGCDILEEDSKTTHTDEIRSKGTVIDSMIYVEIGKLMECLNLNATSMEEDKENLKRRLFRGPRIHTYSQQIKGVFNTKVQKYKTLTQKMLELCSSLIETVEKESFIRNMSEVTDKRFPDYKTELESINKMLQNMTEEFEIVIRKLIEAYAVSASSKENMNDLSNAIFVCNKWDLVPKRERKAVLEDTKRKISKYCGQLKEWQILQFNADLDLRFQEWKANPTDSFKTLLESLDTLMIRAIETRLRDKYRWLHNFLRAVTGLVTVRITAAELSKEKAQSEMKTAATYLDNVAKELEKSRVVTITDFTVSDDYRLHSPEIV
ncbi:hypothetical protein ACJMK2_029677 [Sinanodonta woodiana]|uniref:Dynein heavy chain tail domain-containing protein n=1 Tax=Sinanodonta woodiana TaxID=1069815 RepID=A0ABD3XCE6_SINWO